MNEQNAIVPTAAGASVSEQPSPISKTALMSQIGSGIKLTYDQRRKLVVDAQDSIINIKPTGEVYVPGVHWRTLLNQVFDPFGWGVVGGAPQLDIHEGGRDSQDKGKSILYRDVFLRIARCTRCYKSINVCQCGGPYEQVCVAQALGAQEYHPTNARLALDDAAEGALTNGLMRCCKIFGIYDNIWSPAVAESVKHRLGVKVLCRTWDNKLKPYWRCLDAWPLDGEQGVAPDSPNREAYTARFAHPKAEPPRPARSSQAAEPKPDDVTSDGHIVEHKTVPPPSKAAPAEGEKILVIRLVQHADGKFWVLNLDPSGEYILDDERMVIALENAKARGQRVTGIEAEAMTTQRGSRRRLVEYKIVGAEKKK